MPRGSSGSRAGSSSVGLPVPRTAADLASEDAAEEREMPPPCRERVDRPGGPAAARVAALLTGPGCEEHWAARRTLAQPPERRTRCGDIRERKNAIELAVPADDCGDGEVPRHVQPRSLVGAEDEVG